MFFNAKNDTVRLNNTDMDYIRFGSGSKILIILPGLGDGLHSVKGTALPMAFMYRKFAKTYTVYAFSRKNDLPEHGTTRDMAEDLKFALDTLGICKASVLGVSMGGMIAQHFAADYPEYVEKLVLAVTAARPSPELTEAVTEWISHAKSGDHTALMDSNVKLIYTDDYYRRNKLLIPITGKLTKPKSYERFFVQANACINHNAYDKLSSIKCPVLIIGGEQDRIIGAAPPRDLAKEIPNSTLKMYPEFGHGLYEEAKDFNDIVLNFLK